MSVSPVPAAAFAPWAPPEAPGAPAGAADALVQGSLDAAKRAFLSGLSLAYSDADRAGVAAAFLRASGGAASGDVPTAALQTLARSIIAHHRHGPAQFSAIA